MRRALGAAVIVGALLLSSLARAQNAGEYHVFTLAGNPAGMAFNTAANGFGAAARFSLPFGIAVARTGDIYLSDSYNFRICKITPRGEVTTLAGVLAPQGASSGSGVFSNPEGLAVDDATGDLYVADAFNNTIRKVSPAGLVTTLAGTAGTTGGSDGVGAAARFNFPRDVAVDERYVYVADSSNHAIRRIEKDTGLVTTLAGLAGSSGSADGIGSVARFSGPWGVEIDRSSSSLVIADYNNQTIRRVTFAGVVTTLAGTPGASGSSDGVGAAARFFQPAGVAVDGAGNIYVADTFNDTVRKLTPNGVVTTIAGSPRQKALMDGAGSSARFSGPHGIAVDASGRIYVADTSNAVVRLVVMPAPPAITGTMTDVVVDRAAPVELDGVAFTTSLYPTFQWFKDGQPIAGATNPSLRIESAQAQDSGAYSVRLANSFGTATSNAFTVTVRAPPVLAAAPAAVTLIGSEAGTLRVTAVGARPISYQWSRGGVPLSGATASTLTTAVPGAYAVDLTNPFGTTTTSIIAVLPAKRLVNLATRGHVRAGADTLIAGFSVRADEGRPKQFMIRGVGPALAGFGVSDPVARPGITLFRGTVPVANNMGWTTGSDAAQLASVARSVGAFPLASGSADAAMLITLTPGNYTVELAGTNGTAGAALLEIYEVAAELNRLVNLSTRGVVSETESMTAGVVVSGTTPVKLLVRAIGPGLTEFGVAGVLARPQLTVFSGRTAIASNVGWQMAPNAGEIAAAATASGAFPLENGSADSAVLLTLQPGNYTAEVRSVTASGVALVEIYEVP